jgi:hypothetical protein
MKKVIYLALFIGFALTNTSCNRDKANMAINNFVATYFPTSEVIANIKDGSDYEVTLDDYTRIDFNGSLFGKPEWEEVDCKHAAAQTMVPSALIPDEIENYVNKLHDSLPIVKLSKKNRGWEIELSNGIEIEFDKRFNVIDFDD